MAKRTTFILLCLLVPWLFAAYAQENDALDFSAGQKLLLFDNFADIPEGAAPPHWKVRGGAVRLEDGRLMVDGGSSTRLTPNIGRWPASFTIEMDIQAREAEEDSLRNVTWMFENGDAWVWHATLTLHANGQCSVFVEIADPGDNQRVACDWLTTGSNQLALSVQEDRLRIYLNGKRLVDMDQLGKIDFQTASLMISPDAIPVSFSAFRIAQSGPITDSPIPSKQLPGPRVPEGSMMQQKGRIEITEPPSGDIWYSGEQKTIAWVSSNVPAVRVTLVVCDDDGGCPSSSEGILVGERLTANQIRYVVPKWVPATRAEIRVRPDPGPLLTDVGIRLSDPELQEKYNKATSDWEQSDVEARRPVVLAKYALTFASPKRSDTYPYEYPIWPPNSLQTITWTYRGDVPPTYRDGVPGLALTIVGKNSGREFINFDPSQMYNGQGWARFVVPDFPLAKEGEFIQPYRIEAWLFDDNGIGKVISTSDPFGVQPGFSGVWDPPAAGDQGSRPKPPPN